MRKIKYGIFLQILAVFLVLVFCWDQKLYAAVTLSVSPDEGGNSLRFGRVDTFSSVDKEVRIRVTGSEGNQYQVFQRMMAPLVNEKGESLDRSVILTGGLLGSNARGSLYIQDVEQLGFSDQQVYSSDQAGTADSFVLLYRVDPSAISATGSFQGQLLYTVRPIGGSSFDEVVLTLTLDAGGDLKIEAQGPDGSDRVRLTTAERHIQDSAFSVSFSSNIGGSKIRIYQEVESLPRDELLQPVEEGLVQYLALGGENGDIQQASSAALRPGRELLYESTATHDTVDVFFSVNADVVQEYKAGDYEGSIRYIIESRNGEQTVDCVLALNVASVFELNVEYPQEGMSFRGALESDPPQVREVQVTVKSNLGKPYVINQLIQAPLTNEKGVEFSHEFFTMKEEVLDGDGHIPHDDFSPVGIGEVPLYVSDDQGSSAELKISYRMKPYHFMQAGSYKLQVVYSLGAI